MDFDLWVRSGSLTESLLLLSYTTLSWIAIILIWSCILCAGMKSFRLILGYELLDIFVVGNLALGGLNIRAAPFIIYFFCGYGVSFALKLLPYW